MVLPVKISVQSVIFIRTLRETIQLANIAILHDPEMNQMYYTEIPIIVIK